MNKPACLHNALSLVLSFFIGQAFALRALPLQAEEAVAAVAEAAASADAAVPQPAIANAASDAAPSPAATATVAPQLLGADAVLSAVRAQLATHLAPVAATNVPPTVVSWLARFAAYRDAGTNLPPFETAYQWVGLLDAYWAIPPSDLLLQPASPNADTPPPASMTALLMALPPPACWSHMRELLDARPQPTGSQVTHEIALRALNHLLMRDDAGLTCDADALAASLKTIADGSPNDLRTPIRTLREFAMRLRDRDDAKALLGCFQALIQMWDPAGTVPQTLAIPDIANLVGADETRTLIAQALDKPNLQLRITSSGPTLTIAQSVALEKMKTLTMPPWGLVQSVTDLALYEAIAARFPSPAHGPGDVGTLSALFTGKRPWRGDDGETDDQEHARHVYIMGLVITGRVDDAVQQVLAQTPDRVSANALRDIWTREGRLELAANRYQFYERLLDARPSSDFWDDYVAAAFSTAKAETALAFATAQRDDPQNPFAARMHAQAGRITALLALDRLDDAVADMRQTLAHDVQAESIADQQLHVDQCLTFAANLCRLGALGPHPEWMTESVAAAREIQRRQRLLSGQADDHGFRRRLDLSPMYEPLLEARQFPLLEPLLQDGLADAAREQAQVGRGYAFGPLAELMWLVRLYDAAGRPADVIALAEQAPWWGVGDLADVRYGDEALSVALASALHAVGRTPDATRIVRDHLLNHPADDNAYALLIAMGGDDLIAWLDALYDRDRFEERPLIWKAELLRRQGKLEEAEVAVRLALKVDPTDGEQQAGDRCRAYRVLGDILEARNQKDDAAFCRRVVESVRLAEEGDTFTQLGLTKRSVDLYTRASAVFADAYCVQWRLAERLYALGQLDQAREHYEAAFQRMPEQFGQVASFCFGCEGAFDHDVSRSAAERVLTHAAEVSPDRPQIPYLLGLLRSAEGRDREAFDYFNRAVELDPDYLDAWGRLLALAPNLLLSVKEQDHAFTRALELDPLQRHVSVNLRETTFLASAWMVLSQAEPLRIERPRSLFVFSASRAALEDVQESADWSPYRAMRMAALNERGLPPTPGDMLMNHEVVQAILPLLETAAPATSGFLRRWY
ncbi:MAG: tetratricopeptide repeat protein [Lentisphaerae bacterium]|nr:tetratricopeptide repeat protein [Lentisphaerota bacterium]